MMRSMLTFGLLMVSGVASAGGPAWQRIAVDGQFRAEGVAAADFNNDGQIDIAAGDVWYVAPEWKPQPFRVVLNREGKPTEKYDGSKGYSNCFASWAYDINRDGWQDIIVVGFPGAPFHWYENPQNKPGLWKQYEIWHSACNETPLFTDVTGDGVPEVILGSQPERQMGFLSVPSAEKCREKWAFHAVSEAGEPNQNGTFMYYHGLGVGDLNQDGRLDVLIPHGWWEAPENRTGGLWDFHPLPLAKNNEGNPLPASNLFTIDLDLDGDNDIVMSSAHGYGIWWFENPGAGKAEPFKYHLIDESFSQTHALALVDLLGDDVPYLVTGKRYFAHMGPDPGEFDPVVMFAIEISRSPGQPPSFIKHEILEGKDTGVGTQFQMADFNQDRRPDVILSNKKGVNVLLQK